MDRSKDQARELSQALQPYEIKEHNGHEEWGYKMMEQSWASSRFFAAILKSSRIDPKTKVTSTDLRRLRNNFLKETGIATDLSSLFQDNWLRNIHGNIKISGAIASYASRSLDNFLKNEHVIRFLLKLIKEKKTNSLPKEEFEVLLKEASLPVDLESIRKHHYIRYDNAIVTIQNIVYYKVAADRTNELKFIKFINDVKVYREQSLQIKPKLLIELHKYHLSIFPLTPALKEFIKAGVFEKKGSYYLIKLRNNDMRIAARVRQTAGSLLWTELCATPEFKNDQERVWHWYDRCVAPVGECAISEFAEPSLKTRFLDAALEIVLTDTDLASGEIEYDRIQLDQPSHYEAIDYVRSEVRQLEKFPNSDNLATLYQEMDQLENKAHHNLFWGLSCREETEYFVHEIVSSESCMSAGRILSLLHAGKSQPYLLYRTAYTTYTFCPSAIPSIIIDPITCALGYTFLDKIKGEQKTMILSKGYTLLCHYLSHSPVADKDKAKIILHCFDLHLRDKYETSRINTGRVLDQRKVADTNLQMIRKIFAETTTHYFSNFETNRSESWITSLLPGMLAHITESPTMRDERYVGLSLPLAILDNLIFMLQLTDKNEIDLTNPSLTKGITETIFKFYLGEMNIESIETWNYFDNHKESQIPTWLHQADKLSLLNWSAVIVTFYSTNFLPDFLDIPSLRQIPGKPKENTLVVQKIRTHLHVLLLAHKQIFINKFQLANKDIAVTVIIQKLEHAIANLIKLHSEDNKLKGIQDIFNTRLESTYWQSDNVELLPMVAFALNHFRPEIKEEIITELLKKRDLTRTLKLLDSISSEKDKARLYKSVTKEGLAKFFEEQSSKDEVEYILDKLSDHKGFNKLAEAALKTWESKKPRAKDLYSDQHDILCFRLNLKLAYLNKDEDRINRLQPPKLTISGHPNFRPEEDKEFYRGLIKYDQDQVEASYAIFNRLLNKATADQPVLALNRFASMIKDANQSEEIKIKRQKFSGALEEWETFESRFENKDGFEFIKEHIWYNKLEVYHEIEDYHSFDQIAQLAENTVGMQQHFLELKVKNFIKRGLQPHADKLLHEAINFHRLENGTIPEWLQTLTDLNDTGETVAYLRDQYLRIISRSTASVIQILPPLTDKPVTLASFLLHHIISASDDMLTRINAISSIKSETKYSDLLILALHNSLRFLGWFTASVNGGFPESGAPNPGLIDFAIHDTRERIALCEALILKGGNRNSVARHNFKIFNYSPSRKLFFIIVYYTGPSHKFEFCMLQYKHDILNRVNYPSSFRISNIELEDLSDEFNNDSIKVIKSVHGKQTPVYHIFININYKAS